MKIATKCPLNGPSHGEYLDHLRNIYQHTRSRNEFSYQICANDVDIIRLFCKYCNYEPPSWIDSQSNGQIGALKFYTKNFIVSIFVDIFDYEFHSFYQTVEKSRGAKIFIQPPKICQLQVNPNMI